MQRSLRGAIEQLGSDDYVYVSVSVDPNDTPDRLAAYAEQEGFNWIFAPGTPELLQALIAAFGQSVAFPPGSPHFVIGPSGVVTKSDHTVASSEDLVAEITAVNSGG